MQSNNKQLIQTGKKERLLALTHWPNHHDWPPIGGLRHLVFNAKTNGFDKVIRRVGRRILIDEAAFFAWVEEKNQGGSRHES